MKIFQYIGLTIPRDEILLYGLPILSKANTGGRQHENMDIFKLTYIHLIIHHMLP